MAAKKEVSIEVQEVKQGRVEFCILGETPTIMNRMSQKVLRELMMPKGKKTPSEKASTLKHDPMQEFRDSAYTDKDPRGPTLLQHLGTMFKNAIRSAAVDIPGAAKSQIGRLTWVNGQRIAVYGIPQVFMAVTRSADMNRTPDVRTRLIIPKWACRISVSFVQPLIREQTVANLLAFAGISQGIGDWRPQKGAGTFGQFKLVDEDDPEFVHLLKHGGRKAQEAAMKSPEAYDDETREMLDWFAVESRRRGFQAVA